MRGVARVWFGWNAFGEEEEEGKGGGGLFLVGGFIITGIGFPEKTKHVPQIFHLIGGGFFSSVVLNF